MDLYYLAILPVYSAMKDALILSVYLGLQQMTLSSQKKPTESHLIDVTFSRLFDC